MAVCGVDTSVAGSGTHHLMSASWYLVFSSAWAMLPGWWGEGVRQVERAHVS